MVEEKVGYRHIAEADTSGRVQDPEPCGRRSQSKGRGERNQAQPSRRYERSRGSEAARGRGSASPSGSEA